MTPIFALKQTQALLDVTLSGNLSPVSHARATWNPLFLVSQFHRTGSTWWINHYQIINYIRMNRCVRIRKSVLSSTVFHLPSFISFIVACKYLTSGLRTDFWSTSYRIYLINETWLRTETTQPIMYGKTKGKYSYDGRSAAFEHWQLAPAAASAYEGTLKRFRWTEHTPSHRDVSIAQR